MAKQVQAKPIQCLAVTGKTPSRSTPNNSIRIPSLRIFCQTKIMQDSSQGLFSGYSRRSRIIQVKKGIISIFTAHFYRSIMRRYTIFYRYDGAYIGFSETESLESA